MTTTTQTTDATTSALPTTPARRLWLTRFALWLIDKSEGFVHEYRTLDENVELRTKAACWDDHVKQRIAGRAEQRDALRMQAITTHHGKRGTGLIEATAVLVHVFGIDAEAAAIIACDWVRVARGGGEVHK